MIVVELFGLPGCGKSTLCKEIEAELQSTGRIVKNDDAVYQNSSREKVGFVMHQLSQKEGRKRIIYIIAYFSKRYGYKVLLKKFYRIVKIIKMDLKIMDLSKNNECDYLILSEGYVQQLLTVLDGNTIDINGNIIRDIATSRDRYLSVCCGIDIHNSISRINSRSDSNDSFYQMAKNELYTFLEHREKNIERYQSRYAGFKVSMIDDVKDNAKLITNLLMDQYEK